MFELTDKEKEYISIDTVFDNNQVPEYVDSSLYSYGNYNGYLYTENTRASESEVVRRPDAIITLNMLKEITNNTLTIGYAGLNFENSIAYNYNNYLNQTEYTDEMKTEIIKKCFMKGGNITKGVYPDKVGVKFFNVIKGSNLITKLKENFKEPFNVRTNNDDYIITVTRLKDLEMALIENRYDNIFAFLYTVEDKDSQEIRKVICVTINKYSWFKYRKTLSLIPEVIPDIIPESTTAYQKDILELLKAFGEKGPDNTNWKEKLKDILTNPEKAKEKLQNEIHQLITNTKNRKISNIRKQINFINEKIEGFYRSLQELYNKKREEECKMLGAEQDPETQQMIQDALEYTEKCSYIEKYKIIPDSHRISFTVNGPIKYFDPEYAKKVYNNLIDIIDSTSIGTISNETKNAIQELFKNLFIDDKYTLYCSSVLDIILYPEDSSSPLSYYVQSRRYTNEFKYLGQPHLMNYSCLGNNRIEMNKACELGDILGILTVFTTSAQNFNLTDSAVLKAFLEDIINYNPDKKTIKDNTTGEFISFSDVVQKFEEETNKKFEMPSVEQLNYLRKALYAYKRLLVPKRIALAILETVEEGVRITKNGVANENDYNLVILTTETQNNNMRIINMKVLGNNYYHAVEVNQNNENFTKYDFARLLKDYEQTSEETEETEETPRFVITATPIQNVVETTNYTVTVNEGTVYTPYEPAPTEPQTINTARTTPF